MMRTPGAPMKRKRTVSRVFKKKKPKLSKRGVSKQHVRKTRQLRKQRGRSGGDAGDRYGSGITTRRKYARHIRKTLSRLDKQQSRATWSSYLRVASSTGYQQIQSFSVGFGGALPTTDPLTPQLNDLRKIWWEYTGTATGSKTRGIVLDRINHELEISCQSENPCNITLYTYVARRDQSNAPETAWGTGLTDIMLKQSGVTGGNVDAYHPGVTPFQSTPFCQNFKIIGTKNMTLNPGKTVKVTNSYAIKKRFDAKLFENGETYKKGITHGVLMVIKGNMVNEYGAQAAPEIMVGPTCVLVSVKENVFFKVDNTENRDTNMVFYNVANPTALVQPAGINPAAGAIDTNMQNVV